MRPLVRILILVFFFCVDVHVRAESVASEKREAVSVPSGKLVLAPHSLIETSEESVHLVKGDFYYSGGETARFKTPFAAFHCSGECKVLVRRFKDKVRIKNMLGSVIVRRAGDAQDYYLPVGMQFTVGLVTGVGVADMEFPQSLPWDETVKLWASLYIGEAKQFKSDLEEFREEWRHAVEAVSDLHRDRAHREIASAIRAADDAARSKAEIEKENASLRKLFREKSGY